MQDVTDNIFSSEIYEKMTLLEKRKYTKKYIYSYFHNNEDFSKYYYERKKINNNTCKNILIGFVVRDDL